MENQETTTEETAPKEAARPESFAERLNAAKSKPTKPAQLLALAQLLNDRATEAVEAGTQEETATAALLLRDLSASFTQSVLIEASLGEALVKGLIAALNRAQQEATAPVAETPDSR